MSISKIEWTDRTWNPARGCSRVSEGCRNCYAETIAARFSAPGAPFAGFAERTKSGPRWTGRVDLIPGKLAEPLSWRQPQRVFVNSMSDLFHEALPFEDIAAVFGVMAATPYITFQILTKRPERMLQWFEWIAEQGLELEAAVGVKPTSGSPVPGACATFSGEETLGSKGWRAALNASWPLLNVWPGVSAENQATADERIPLLLRCPAAVRFVSYEPALGPVDFTRLRSAGHSGWIDALGKREHRGPACFERDTGIDWLIVGGESGPGARPFDIAWARSSIEQCKAAGVPVFVKQIGAHPFATGGCYGVFPNRPSQKATDQGPGGKVGWTFRLRDRKGGDMSEWPEDLRVREFPGETPRR